MITGAGLFLFSLSCISCATYQGKVAKSRQLIVQGQYEEATKYLQPLAEDKNGDQLVYLLDYAVSLQLAGKTKESNAALQSADRLADFQDYFSLSRQAGSLILNQEMVQYKGDSFEKIYINAAAALNYLELNQLDEALVETRRMNEKYNLLNTEDRKNFEKNVFGKYLSGLIWEANQNWDDAYIAYEEAYKLDPSIPTLPEDLLRVSKKARRLEAHQKWKKEFPNVVEKKEWTDKTYGELVIIVEQGWGPRKTQISNSALPVLIPVSSETARFRATIDGVGQYSGETVYNVERAAIETLEHDYTWLAAKRVGAFATKMVLADQVRQKNEALGVLTSIALQVSERADLRQWSTLPQTVQILRIPLKAKSYNIQLQGLNYSGAPTAEAKAFQNITIKPQRSTFLRWRTIR
jgi:hypothetical protein